MQCFRLDASSGSASFSFPLSASTSCAGTGPLAALESCNVSVAITSKNAALSRPDGGDVTLSYATYTGDTLLSWPVDPSNPSAPGPTSQTLTGTYGGTWTQKTFTNADGSTYTGDNTSVTWAGANPFGGITFAPPDPDDVHTTSYPPSNGFMPLDSGSLSPQTTKWTYQVKDNGDGTQLNLTWKWICHYAFENVSESTTRTVQANNHVVSAYLDGTDTTSATLNVPAYTFIATTGFTYTNQNSPSDTSIPGFSASGEHVAYQALRSQWGQTTTLTSNASSQTVQFNLLPGYYGYETYLNEIVHVCNATGWNSKGSSAPFLLDITLDNDASIGQSEYYSPSQGS